MLFILPKANNGLRPTAAFSTSRSSLNLQVTLLATSTFIGLNSPAASHPFLLAQYERQEDMRLASSKGSKCRFKALFTVIDDAWPVKRHLVKHLQGRGGGGDGKTCSLHCFPYLSVRKHHTCITSLEDFYEHQALPVGSMPQERCVVPDCSQQQPD